MYKRQGAQSLKVVKNYPQDGQTNTTKDNMCVKLWFNNDMDGKDMEKINKDCFSITDPKGKKIPIKVYYNNPKAVSYTHLDVYKRQVVSSYLISPSTRVMMMRPSTSQPVNGVDLPMLANSAGSIV